MKVSALKTHKITAKDKDLFKILDKYVKSFKDRSVLAVTSKIVSICEGRMVLINTAVKKDIVIQEADYFLEKEVSQYNIMFSIKNNIMAADAGVDESNGNGYYILWPQDPQAWANKIRGYLCRRFGVRYAGVVITDSRTMPLRWGTGGVAIVHSGFEPLQDYIGKTDIFGRKFKYVKQNIADGLAASAVLVMGEGKEQTPLTVMEDVPFVKFQDHNPTKKELDALHIEIEDDLYGPILTKAPWKKGGRSRKDVL